MKKIWVAILIIVLIVLGVYFWADSRNIDTELSQTEEAGIREVVLAFGDRIEAVPLLGTEETIVNSIRDNYTPYVTEDLLNRWIANPRSAPGREVSSPWPDRIEIMDIRKVSNEEYLVNGDIVEITSVEQANGGVAAKRNVEILVERDGGDYFISQVTVGEYDPTANWELYNEPGQFSLEHPADFVVEEGVDFGVNIGESIVKISFPEESFNETPTNFNDAYFVISASEAEEDVAICTNYGDLGSARPGEAGEIQINGVTFSTWSQVEAAAGNLYESKLYRTVRDNRCYEAALVLHTGNIANYPEGTVIEFDKTQAFSVLENILFTLNFE